VALRSKDLLGIQELSTNEIQLILDTAANLRNIAERPIKKVPTLRGRTVANLFYEPSTRTRISFELAAKRLSADFINVTAATSSAATGETLTDTAKAVQAMQVEFLVVRHSMAGAPHQLAREVEISVVNAGDGPHEHPTQALVDLFTILDVKGYIEGLKVAIIGDHITSPAGRSSALALIKMGAEVTLVGPSPLIPPGADSIGVYVEHSMEEGVAGADVILLSRVEINPDNELRIPSLREYARFFCLTETRLALAEPGCLVLHWGSMNRGVEIAPDVARVAEDYIAQQITDGIAVRMAVLYLLSGGDRSLSGGDRSLSGGDRSLSGGDRP
jgi:aspartate carbamoyltransferase catalytic subunit